MAGYGKRFDFGFHDKQNENEGTYPDPTTYSSCMTTIESRPNYRYKYCDTKQVLISIHGLTPGY